MFLVLGDIHGEFKYVKWCLKTKGIENAIVYQVGDFGVGFHCETHEMSSLLNLNNFLKSKNIHLYTIRGNHDDPYYFDGHLMDHFSNLHLLPDYTIIDVYGKKVLGVGGAISVDRKWRLDQMRPNKWGKKKTLYWENEVFVLNEEKLNSMSGVDVVITHTAPSFVFPMTAQGFGPTVASFAKSDQNLYNDLIKERSDLSKMWDLLKKNNKVTHYFYGHFHDSFTGFDDGCEFRLLDVNEFHDTRFDYGE